MEVVHSSSFSSSSSCSSSLISWALRKCKKVIYIGRSSKYFLSETATNYEYLVFYTHNYMLLGLDKLQKKIFYCDVENCTCCHGYMLMYIIKMKGDVNNNPYLFSRRQREKIFSFEDHDEVLSIKYPMSNYEAWLMNSTTLDLVDYFKEKYRLLFHPHDNDDDNNNRVLLPFEVYVALLYCILQDRWIIDSAFREEVEKYDFFFNDTTHENILGRMKNIYGWLITILKYSKGLNPCECIIPKIQNDYILATEGRVLESCWNGLTIASHILMSKPKWLNAIQTLYKFGEDHHTNECCHHSQQQQQQPQQQQTGTTTTTLRTWKKAARVLLLLLLKQQKKKKDCTCLTASLQRIQQQQKRKKTSFSM